MVPRNPEETTAQKNARIFFDRRRAGLDGKVRSLILGLANKHNVDINVTVIYEYRDELSIFRSQPGDTGRWFSSVKELRARSINCTDMGHVDPMTRELIEWLQRQPQQVSATPEAPSTPRRSARSDHTRLEDISVVGDHQARRAGPNSAVDEATVNDTDEDDKTDGDDPDDSEDDSEDEDYQLVERPIGLGLVKKEPSCEDFAQIHRQSPKRRRGMMDSGSQGNVSSFPSSNTQPIYHPYAQFNGTSPQMQLAGPSHGMGSYLPQTGIAPMAIMSQPQSNLNSDNCFYNDIGLGNFDLGSAYGSERTTQGVPFRTQHRPELPQPPLSKKGRTTKALKKGRSELRRTKSG